MYGYVVRVVGDVKRGERDRSHNRKIFFLIIYFSSSSMDLMKKGWFSEKNDLWPGVSLSLEVNKVLHEESSEFQDILVLDT